MGILTKSIQHALVQKYSTRIGTNKKNQLANGDSEYAASQKHYNPLPDLKPFDISALSSNILL